MRHQPVIVVSLGFLLALAFGACENNRTSLTEKQANEGLGIPDTSSSGKRAQLDPECKLDELITNAAADTPDAVIATMLEAANAAASGQDEAGNFKKFFSQFMDGTEERRVREDFWGRAKKWVGKYLQQDAAKGISFKICERRDEGRGEVKIFIQSLDYQKSNPPIRLRKNDAGVWKVTFYTP